VKRTREDAILCLSRFNKVFIPIYKRSDDGLVFRDATQQTSEYMTFSTCLDTGAVVVAGATVGTSCKVPFESPLVARSLSRGRSDDMVESV